MPLSHRERVIRALRHQEPDRIPVDLGSTICTSTHIATYQKLKAHFGIKAEDTIINKMMQTAAVHEPILQALDIDFRAYPIASQSPRSGKMAIRMNMEWCVASPPAHTTTTW